MKGIKKGVTLGKYVWRDDTHYLAPAASEEPTMETVGCRMFKAKLSINSPHLETRYGLFQFS